MTRCILTKTFGVWLVGSFWLVSCGGGTVSADNDPPKSEPTTIESPGSNNWRRLEIDPQVENYKPAQLDSVVADPSDDSVLLIRFFLSAVPCEGARTVVSESGDSVTVSVEVGNHKDFAAMTCLAERIGYEMTVQLSAPLGNRELLTR